MYLGNTPTLTIRTDFVFVATNGQTVFTGLDSNGLTLSYNTNNCDVFANGVLQQRIEYTTTSASAITFATPRQANDVITIRSYGVPANVDSIMQGKFETANVGYLGAYRNKIINGNFDIWQRGTSQTITGYGSNDRWWNGNVGSTKTHSRQTFAAGQTDVPGNPTYFSRTVVTSVAGADNFALTAQRVENVTVLAGKRATITFYAKADSNRNIAVEINQYFGNSGSARLFTPIGLIALTTNWKRYDVIVDVPSIAGKTIDINNFSEVVFWFDAGSIYAARTANLGQQSGTFDIAHVSLVEGDARLETDPFSPRHPQQELALCQRYFQSGQVFIQGYISASTNNIAYSYSLPVAMRSTPVVSKSTVVKATIVDDVLSADPTKMNVSLSTNGTGSGNGHSNMNYTLDAEL